MENAGMLAATRMMGTSVPDRRYNIETRSGRYSSEDIEAKRPRNFATNITLNPNRLLKLASRGEYYTRGGICAASKPAARWVQGNYSTMIQQPSPRSVRAIFPHPGRSWG